jgi:hypothetical protein
MRGICEPDAYGRHATLANCQAVCRPTYQRDLMLLVYRNNPADSALLAPSDREEVLWAMVGVRYSPQRTRGILLALANEDVRPLLADPVLMNYAGRIWDPQVLRTALLNSGDFRALGYLQQSVQQLTSAEREQFARAALFAGDSDAIQRLYELGEGELLRSLDEVYLQPSMAPTVLAVMFRYDGDHLSYYIPSAARQDVRNFLEAAMVAGYTSQEEIDDYRDASPLPASNASDDDADDVADEYDYLSEED